MNLIDSKDIHFGEGRGNPIPDPRCNCHSCDKSRSCKIALELAGPDLTVGDIAKAMLRFVKEERNRMSKNISEMDPRHWLTPIFAREEIAKAVREDVV